MSFMSYKKIAAVDGEVFFDPDAVIGVRYVKDGKGKDAKIKQAFLLLKSHTIELDISSLPTVVNYDTLGEWVKVR